MRRERRSLIWLWVALTAAVMVTEVLVDASTGTSAAAMPLRFYAVIISLAAPVSGALIISKRPGNRIGWLLLLGSIYFPANAGLSLLGRIVPEGLEAWMLWGSQVTWAVSIPAMVVFIPLLFPDGRLLSTGWRPIAGIAAVGIGVLALANAVDPNLLGESAANPAAFRGAGTVSAILMPVGVLGFAAGFVGGFVAIGRRFRRARGVERLQIRWLFVGAGAALIAWVMAAGLETAGHRETGGWVFATGFTLVPVAVASAVLRYRLYEIDRVVRRTVSYGATVLVLAAIYAIGVVGIGALLREVAGGSSGDLVVAASTLAVAAAFHPVRRRVQMVVDRRFDRARFDAERTVGTFVATLRDETDLDAVAGGLVDVTARTMRPRSASLWLP